MTEGEIKKEHYDTCSDLLKLVRAIGACSSRATNLIYLRRMCIIRTFREILRKEGLIPDARLPPRTWGE